MNCERIREQLGAFFDDEVSLDVRREFEKHLSECTDCCSELDSLRQLADALALPEPTDAPDQLWSDIERRLDENDNQETESVSLATKFRLFRKPMAAAASLLLVVGAGLVAITILQGTTATASVATVDFSILLDALPFNAQNAFTKFLTQYKAKEIEPSSVHERAPNLNFEVPAVLQYGFHRKAVYLLRFGDAPGIAAEYYRDNGEFLAVLFHETVHEEDFGTHKDRKCIVGKHRGRTVEVGLWRLVHLTDPSTCHCVLSQLDLEREIPTIMAAVAPRSVSLDGAEYEGKNHDHSSGKAP